jgi:polyferredoxin
MSTADQEQRPTSRRWLKAVIWVIVIAVAVVVLFQWVFPWVESLQQDPTLDAAPAATRLGI